MNNIKFNHNIKLHDYHNSIVKNVPMYRSEDIDAMFCEIDYHKRDFYVRDTFNSSCVYISTHSYIVNKSNSPYTGPRYIWKRGPNNSYYFATPELDNFVKQQCMFALISGKINKMPKRVLRDIYVRNLGPTGNGNYMSWKIKPIHLNCTIITKNTNLKEVIAQ